MQTEFPRGVIPTESGAKDCASAAFHASTPELTDDDVALIDLRYHQFMALAELDLLMEDL